MNTQQTEDDRQAAQIDAIRRAARIRVAYIRWLAKNLEKDRCSRTIRLAAAFELRQLIGDEQ